MVAVKIQRDAVGVGRLAKEWIGKRMGNIVKGRRYGGSGSARIEPLRTELDAPRQASRLGRGERLAGCAVGVVTVTLVALTWMVTIDTVREQRIDVLERAEQTLAGQAAVMAEAIGQELALIEQGLGVIQAAWKADSTAVDLGRWRGELPALTAVADELYISDENHVVRQDTLAQAIGQAVGSAYIPFPHGALEQYEEAGFRRRDLLLSDVLAGAGIDARQFLTYIVRPLDHPAGWEVGASFRSAALPKLFAGSAEGYSAVVALIDTRRGVLQSVAGPAARRAKTALSDSALLGAMTQSSTNTWLGETAIDGVDRISCVSSGGGS